MNIYLISPVNGETVSLLAAQHKEFLRDGGFEGFVGRIDYLNLMKTGVEDSHGKPVRFVYEIEGDLPEAADIFLEIADEKSFINERRYPCGVRECEIYNLFIGKSYYWRVRVSVGGNTFAVSQSACFITEDTAPRMIKAEGISNIRDLGGWKTVEGRRVRQGLLYRGSEFDSHQTLTSQSKHVLLGELNLKTDLDLRKEAVGKIDASPLDPSVKLALIPVAPYIYMEDTKDGYLNVFKLLADKANYPVYFHCWGGCDRTGTVAFMTLALLGVSQEDLFMDYDFTSFSVWGPRSVKAGDFVRFLEYLAKWGSEGDSFKTKCENWLYDIGITKDDVDAIREIMLED